MSARDAFRWPPLALISWPFEFGTPDLGMGIGASLLAGDKELHDDLAAAGWTPTLERIPAADPSGGEVTRIFDLLRAHAGAVRAAVRRGAFPLVLSGGCISAAATVAGAAVDGQATGAVWFDAHADLDTPEDNLSGSMDVQALSILTGSAWQAAARAIPWFAPVREEDVLAVGVRDLADHQRLRLERSAIRTFDAAALATLPTRVYLHVDLDVLGTEIGVANRYACAGGPSLDGVLATIDATFDHATVIAAALTAYEPRSDRSGAIRAAAHAIATLIAKRALEQR
ncbi:Arginase [Baekduia alba]|uniref:arginase family protein n=1 Tax=Baekduia alba TaxID=2997333 RepID=UPI0023407EC8|nr:arginase family protein [Baekduia alba]WCB92671.1 Arginase [Baekduia alba]